MVGSVRLLIAGSNADMTATRRYFGEWTTSECRGDQHDDLFNGNLVARRFGTFANTIWVKADIAVASVEI
jgi:hypothetical protein